jgi:hypothetical protein
LVVQVAQAAVEKSEPGRSGRAPQRLVENEKSHHTRGFPVISTVRAGGVVPGGKQRRVIGQPQIASKPQDRRHPSTLKGRSSLAHLAKVRADPPESLHGAARTGRLLNAVPPLRGVRGVDVTEQSPEPVSLERARLLLGWLKAQRAVDICLSELLVPPASVASAAKSIE